MIGAAFVIGLQIAAILSYGTISRVSLLQSQVLLAHMPDLQSGIWWPARAAMGDGVALLGVLAVSLAMLTAVIAVVAPRFGEYAITAAGVDASSIVEVRRATAFRATSPSRALRTKEWTLLRRDPWLASQTLMQMLYLIPPAVLLWRSFDDGNGAYQLLVPVLVMAAGQLAGGLAWLAISGEDAPDLVASAPISSGFIVRAKVEAVLVIIAVIFAPLVAALAIASPWHALVTAVGIVISRSGCHLDPALVPQPGQTQPISPPSGLLAVGHFRRGLFVDRLGGHGGGRRRQSVARHRAGLAGVSGGRRRLVHEPATAAHVIMLSTRRTLL